jgi:hypothetical protein
VLKKASDPAPLYPPYPRPSEELYGWRLLGLAAWPVGLVLCLIGHEWPGIIFLIPGLIWTANLPRRNRALRFRALDGVEARAATMTVEERERCIAEIIEIYGGKSSSPAQRRIQEILSQPGPS